jgi:putative membrane protein
MYIKRNYGFWQTFAWSSKPFLLGLLYSAAICLLCFFVEITVIIPWSAVTVIGIAVAFYLGFKNNSSYDRTWEARKIWGGIVNSSRSFGVAVVAFVQGDKAEEIKKELIYRHIAWMTALRHQLRLGRPWEHLDLRLDSMFYWEVCEDYNNKLDKELALLIPQDEVKALDPISNKATQILKNQSARLQELKDQGYFEDFRHMEFHHHVTEFFTDQGKSERIKNFPFPRQYASTALWMTFVFCFFVPFGMVDAFRDVTGWLFWVCPVISALIIWIFFLMEKIGDYSENPFEGTYNDVPITQISRGIEIDLKEMINDENIPPAIKDENGFVL